MFQRMVCGLCELKSFFGFVFSLMTKLNCSYSFFRMFYSLHDVDKLFPKKHNAYQTNGFDAGFGTKVLFKTRKIDVICDSTRRSTNLLKLINWH